MIIRIKFSSSSGIPRCRLTDGSELLIPICIGFLGEDETLVTRTKIVYQRGLASLAGVICTAVDLLRGLLAVRVWIVLELAATIERYLEFVSIKV